MVTKPPVGEDVEGLNLDYFHVGSRYDVDSLVAALFLAEGWAEPDEVAAPEDPEPFSADEPFVLTPPDRSRPPQLVRQHHPPHLPRDIAANRSRRRRRRRK